jgi:hypothetical protein
MEPTNETQDRAITLLREWGNEAIAQGLTPDQAITYIQDRNDGIEDTDLDACILISKVILRWTVGSAR